MQFLAQIFQFFFASADDQNLNIFDGEWWSQKWNNAGAALDVNNNRHIEPEMNYQQLADITMQVGEHKGLFNQLPDDQKAMLHNTIKDTMKDTLKEIREQKVINMSRDAMDPKMVELMDKLDGAENNQLDVAQVFRNMDLDGNKQISPEEMQKFKDVMKNAIDLPAKNEKSESKDTPQFMKDFVKKFDHTQMEAFMDAIGAEIDVHTDKDGKMQYIDISELPKSGPVINFTGPTETKQTSR